MIQHIIGIHDANQTHIVEIQSFGEHLRPDEHIDFTVLETVYDFLEPKFPFGRVLVHAADGVFWKQLLQFELDLFGPETFGGQIHTIAGLAMRRLGDGVTAIMATQLVLEFVVGQTHIAVLALRHVPTGQAFQHRRIPAAVLEQNDLLAQRQRIADVFLQHVRKMTVHLFAEILVLQIDEFDVGQKHIPKTFGEFGQAVFAGFGVVV